MVNVSPQFGPLALAPYHEVVEAALPDVGGFQALVPQRALCRVGRSRSTQKLARETWFEHLHHGRGIPLLRFADQKMKMFGHDYVADHHETIPLTHLFEDVQKKIATTSAAEQTPTLITTGGYEMQIAGAVVSL